MTAVVAYGIDYGTSNSSVASVDTEGDVRVLPVTRQGGSMLRSLVYLERSGNRLSGDESVRAYLADGSASTRCSRCALVERVPSGTYSNCGQYERGSGCQDSRLMAQLKTDLSSDSFVSTHSWGTDFSLIELVAVVLKRLKREADRQVGQDVRRLALGRPVRFVGVEEDPDRLQPLAEGRLRAAAVAAGFDEVVLVPESQAAVTAGDVGEGLVVCTDFGGGTFDIAVLERTGSRDEVLALGGAPVGGEEFDSRIFDAKMEAPLGLGRSVHGVDGKLLSLPNGLRRQFRSLGGLKRLLSDRDVAVILREIAGRDGGEFAEVLAELLYGGQAYACFAAIERAKIELSTQEHATITLKRAPHIDLDIPFTRAEFERLISDDLLRVRHQIEDTLEDAGVAPADVSCVTCTGGSSQVPAFRAMLADLFDADRIVEHDAFATVVTGLAKYAFAEWGEAA